MSLRRDLDYFLILLTYNVKSDPIQNQLVHLFITCIIEIEVYINVDLITGRLEVL